MSVENQYQIFLNRLPLDWSLSEISKLGAIAGGSTPSRENSLFWNGDIPWVTPGEVSGNQTKFLASTAEKITKAGLNGSGANLLPSGSLMITTRATLGARVINAVPMTTNQGFKSIVFRNDVDASFYYYLFEKIKPELVRRASGTTFLEISGSEFSKITVPNPSNGEKRVIANILDTLDTTIRQTEAIIAKLQQVKQGLLHNLLTRGIDANGQLRPPVELAPHLYKESPLGWIPREWEVCLLDEVAIRGSGHTPNKSVLGYWNGGIKWVSLADSDKLDQIFIWDTDKQISELGIANSSAVKHPSGTVILSRDAGVGKSAILGEQMAVSQHFMAWQCGKRLNNVFLYYWLQSNKPQFESIAMGSTIKTIGLPFFKHLQIVVPPRREQDAAGEVMFATESDLKTNQSKLLKYRMLKSALMDDLLTGRVRVTALLSNETPAFKEPQRKSA